MTWPPRSFIGSCSTTRASAQRAASCRSGARAAAYRALPGGARARAASPTALRTAERGDVNKPLPPPPPPKPRPPPRPPPPPIPVAACRRRRHRGDGIPCGPVRRWSAPSCETIEMAPSSSMRGRPAAKALVGPGFKGDASINSKCSLLGAPVTFGADQSTPITCGPSDARGHSHRTNPAFRILVYRTQSSARFLAVTLRSTRDRHGSRRNLKTSALVAALMSRNFVRRPPGGSNGRRASVRDELDMLPLLVQEGLQWWNVRGSERLRSGVTEEEANMLRALAERQGLSASDVLRQYIRNAYAKAFPPKTKR